MGLLHHYISHSTANYAIACVFDSKFVNYMMYDGKKSLSQNILKEVWLALIAQIA